MEVGLLTEAQHEQMVDLLLDLYEHYNPGRALGRDVVRNHLLDNLCGTHSQIRLVTAGCGDELLGFAAIYLVYSLVEPEPANQRQCVLKELFVSPRHRSQGVGLELMKWVAQYAVNNGCGRIDWSVKSSNARGIAFYEGLGARLVSDRLSYRMVREDVGALAGGF